VVFWVLTPYIDVVEHQRAFHPEDGSSKILRNVCVLPRHYMASQHKRPRLDSSWQWKS